MSVLGVPRRTPGTLHVQLAMLSLLTQGLGIGFLGILVSRQQLFGQPAGFAVLAAAGGALVALLPGRPFSARSAPGPITRGFLVGCGIVAGGGLIAMHFVPRAGLPEEASLLLLGLATGACSRLALALLLPMLPARGAASLLGLAGVSFGTGGLLANAASVVATSAAIAGELPLWAAAVPLLLAFAAVKARDLRLSDVKGIAGAHDKLRNTSPRSILLAASLALQGATCVIAACWLTVYLSREVGLSEADELAIAALFWMALCTGVALARRLPRIRENLATVAMPPTLAVPGGFLLLADSHPGVALGTTLLGLALGLLFPLTLGLVHWPSVLARCRWILRSLHLALPFGLSAAWMAEPLASVAGSWDWLIWAIVGCFLLASSSVAVLMADYRLSGDPALV